MNDIGWFVFATNDSDTKDALMDEISAVCKNIGIRYGYEWKMRYTNTVFRRGKSRYTFGRGDGSIYELTSQFSDYKRRYGLTVDNRHDKMAYIADYNYVDYHTLENRVDLSGVNEWMSKGKENADFEKDSDFSVKREIFNSVFGVNYKTYDEMIEHKHRSFQDAADVSRSAIANEPGRTLGFLHELKAGKERLKNQIDAMVNVMPVMPIHKRDSDIFSIVPILKPEANLNKM